MRAAPKKFQPRDMQLPMIAHGLQNKRCAIWAKPGTGKTTATFAIVDALHMSGEDAPVLVLAPLRVARRTWSDEAHRWADFGHLSVMPVLGTPEERMRAMRSSAPVFTTNYENLAWLVEFWGDRWPYRTVIADESTKLKSLRVSVRTARKKDGSPGKEYIAGQGGVRAKALSKIAHTHIDRFIELTGTPSPNGLLDLWGQLWFLDAGKRLGRTFEGFKERWFSASYDGYGSTAKEHAEAQIHEAVKDLCLTIDPRDYYDLAEPVVNTVFVDLPAKARKLYREFEKEMFLSLEDRTVEAFGGAAKTQKCLAEGTEVLTPRGWKGIEDIGASDLVWDGVEWVPTAGAVYNGLEHVVTCWGVDMTPDHRVLTGDGWREAQEILDGESSEGPNRHDVRIPDGFAEGGESRDLRPLGAGVVGRRAYKARVYDIVNAGPRHRFLVRGRGGEVFLAHNCLQLANGAVYVDPLVETDRDPRAKEWRHIHDAKLEALADLLSETGDDAVIVVYQFKSDLARLQKAFPSGRALKTEADEDDFKAGRIKLLFMQPQGASHGIDGFQYVCNTMVFFAQDWNLENHDQIVERIGPVRQMQAGLNRPVYLHYLVAADTVDELVVERRASKRDIQDLLLESAKRKRLL